jgi:hypothetical protein
MDMVDSVLKFLEAYPTWAKAAVLAAVVVIAGVLLFAKLPAKLPPPPPPPGTTAYLHVTGVALHPPDPSAAVRIAIDVNGTVTLFPSVGAAQWMQVGPGMNPKTIPLPAFPTYQVSFSMEYRDKRKAQNETPLQFTRERQATVAAAQPMPASGEYKLYSVTKGAAAAGVVAVINYRIDFSSQ